MNELEMECLPYGWIRFQVQNGNHVMLSEKYRTENTSRGWSTLMEDNMIWVTARDVNVGHLPSLGETNSQIDRETIKLTFFCMHYH